ncbi:NAD(P)-dependent dehydrogenase, short-chain alcohol dehydrogenase family [Thiohalospira halophila DSM 15071]|uniref:NAD(P)-dependent dehydrogenase, short-chain alcohol dehydrogenase family n=1 Tax=Thiohalospira halophila DSM 15071 TaxID=1123397 RepID=A0A1I1P434_9GAMM|nr:SDR family NAD(P)-dependent oxidoreductase [Thiohalospira halophila]SFD04701.1 NAD(P)-dependent dehydrogenase, short-chain alcohol dehydrogenase family [Thiohalospira halophila DSM 15071]
MSDLSLPSLPEGYRAVVVGASGGLGAAFLERLVTDSRCGEAIGLARDSDPPLELTDEATIAAAAEAVGGPVDCLIVATGALTLDGHGPEKALNRLDPAVLARQFAINATGPALVLKHFAPLLPRRGRSIAAALSARVGSIGDNQTGGWYSYRAAKAALNQLWHTAALEIRRRHPEAILATLQPGTVDTDLTAPYRGNRPALSPRAAAALLLETLDGLEPTDSGGFFDFAGNALPW